MGGADRRNSGPYPAVSSDLNNIESYETFQVLIAMKVSMLVLFICVFTCILFNDDFQQLSVE
jgi:hypothetical protein